MKMHLRTYWPLLGIGVLLIIIIFYIIKGRDEGGYESTTSDTESGEGLRLKDIHYTQDDPDESIKWTLDAKEVLFSKDKQLIFFKKFRLILKPDKKPSIELKGAAGQYDKNSGEINVRGGLQGYFDNGYKINTEHLLYNRKEGSLKTNGPVRIRGPFFSVNGHGLYMDIQKEIIRIVSGVTTQLDMDLTIL